MTAIDLAEREDTFPWWPVLAGFSALLVGIGLSRFAYTPIVPVLIAEGWFSQSAAAYLGAANLAGYLLGAVTAGYIARAAGHGRTLVATLLLAVAAMAASAFPVSFAWYFGWRLLSGVTGGVVMVLAVSLALAEVPARRRGLAGGLIFTGVGAGILVAAAVVPLLLDQGAKTTWLTLSLVSLPFVLVAGLGFRGPGRGRSPAHPGAAMAHAGLRRETAGRWPIRLLVLVYGLTAVGLVPHMVFFADHAARSVGLGIATASLLWGVFGLGALAGPVLAGRLADRCGFRRALHLAIAAEAAGVAAAAWLPEVWALALSAAVVGALVPGAVPLVVGRLHGLTADDASLRQRSWSQATAAFAVGQAGGSYLFSWIFTVTGSHHLLFAIAAGVLAAALIIDLGVAFRQDRWARCPQRPV